MAMAGGGNNPETSEEGDVAVEEGRPKLAEPPRFAVVLLNDDYTTFDFVVEVLQKFFHKNAEEAAQITLKVHHQGRGLAGIYSRQIAETKVSQVEEYARAHSFPLKCIMEETS
jgi:ATP-dependent Clp protease adaptor protein ClpS